MKSRKELAADRTSVAYEEGVRAYLHGIGREACPWTTGQPRMDWYSGWLDAWSDARHGKLFRKYGVEDGIDSSRQWGRHRRLG